MSRKVVGSSSSSSGVGWASAIASQTRWRCPPDSSSTAGRRACRRRSAPGALYFISPLSLPYVLERLTRQLEAAVAGRAPKKVLTP
jgi:hypothetical protein